MKEKKESGGAVHHYTRMMELENHLQQAHKSAAHETGLLELDGL